MNDVKRNNYIIIGLCLVVAIMAIGYAAFSSLLTINGTASTTNSWCLGFDNTKTNTYTITKGVQTGTAPTGSMSYSGTACQTNYVPTASISSVFYQPGDQVEYTFTIKNASTVGAAIKSILIDNQSVTSNTTITKGNIQYIVEMPASTTLAANAETTMKVTAKFQNDIDISGNYTGETQTIEVKINAEQDDGNGGMDIAYTGTVYRFNTNEIYFGTTKVVNISNSYIYGNSAGSMGPPDVFDSMEECVAKYPNQGSYFCQPGINTLGNYTEDPTTIQSSYYLKHDIVNGLITDSYVCYIYNNTRHCMKGSTNGSTYEANIQKLRDYQTFYNLSEVSNPSASNPGCEYNNLFSRCFGGVFDHLHINSSGQVAVAGSASSDCCVDCSGRSRCSGV